MAECRSLIQFLCAFEHHRKAADSLASACSRSRQASHAAGGGSFCDSTPMTVVDAVMLLAVVAAPGFLVAPYARLLCAEMGALLHPAASCLSAAAFFGAAVAVVAAVVAWELLGHHARKYGKPRCRGLKKAVEFDIQLETEECVRWRPGPAARSALLAAAGARPVELGGRAAGAGGRAPQDGATQRPHRAHLPLALRLPQGPHGGLGRQEAPLADVTRHASFELPDDAADVWDCRNTRLLVYDDCDFIVCSPLHPDPDRATVTIPPPPTGEAANSNLIQKSLDLSFHEDCGDDMLCTMVILRCTERRASVHLSDLQDGAWGEVRNSHIIELPEQLKGWNQWGNRIVLAHGKLYMIYPNWHSQDAVVHVDVDVVGDNDDFVFLRIENQVFYMHISNRTVEKVYDPTQEYEYLHRVYPFTMFWPPTFPVLNGGHDDDE
ncbi:hypothetical protein BAE44_0007661 [Dichanthelium oligosanthes]|uniref:F-box protein AT5G49610-like beta-propeller domain-containing protein n=1 Tax=Dichanthelium oligosanthes TaxID=888268 RepID=A0A1E5W1Q6_9POAL|nr:hypothetical protein BAE44_0007661 [Dichanthelium oligosanthes]